MYNCHSNNQPHKAINTAQKESNKIYYIQINYLSSYIVTFKTRSPLKALVFIICRNTETK